MTPDGHVHEIAVRLVKPGASEAFRTARASFIETLTRQPAVLADREFESFNALPAPDAGEVFIGMTTYSSARANAAIQRKPSVVWPFLKFSRTMSLKAYVYVRPVDGPPFDLATLANDPGQILELGVRRVTDHARFDEARRDFVRLLAQQPGVLDSWEFEVVKGRKADGLTVGMTVYSNRAALDAATDHIMTDPITQTYFATFEPVAIQFATSTNSR